MHPGPDAGQDSIVRWTAPAAGTYFISGSVVALDNNPSGINWSLYTNGSAIALYGGYMKGPSANTTNLTYGPAVTFGGDVALNLGDTLSFAVNKDLAYFNDSTGLTLSISSTPLPSTWLMLLTGFLGLGFVAYRGSKKSAAALSAA